MSFTIDQLVGINELEADWLSVRPNPFSDQIVVSSKKQGQLELFDLAGKMVGSYQFDGNQVFDVSTLPAGTYLAVAISGPLRKQFKLVRIP
jgi:hypothetical protein